MSEEVFIKNMTAFLEAQKAAETAEEPGTQQGDFTCPICGNKALWARARGNNHLHCTCTGCGFLIAE